MRSCEYEFERMELTAGGYGLSGLPLRMGWGATRHEN